jgi:hypothetical protein
MNLTDMGRLKEQNAILARMHAEGLKPNVLKAKYLNEDSTHSHHHTCNHGGGHGKAARRNGWHGNGSSRFTVKAWKAYEKSAK